MSEHSIKELERQVDQARSAYSLASDRLHSAEAALKEARSNAARKEWEAAGVTFGRTIIRSVINSRTVGVAHAVEGRFGRPALVIRLLKKDGTPGKRERPIFCGWEIIGELPE